MVWQCVSQVARTGLEEEGAEGRVELMLNTIDMAGDEAVEGTGEICMEKSILSSKGRERLRAWMVSNVG